jgi:hypothetical protein
LRFYNMVTACITYWRFSLSKIKPWPEDLETQTKLWGMEANLRSTTQFDASTGLWIWWCHQMQRRRRSKMKPAVFPLWCEDSGHVAKVVPVLDFRVQMSYKVIPFLLMYYSDVLCL